MNFSTEREPIHKLAPHHGLMGLTMRRPNLPEPAIADAGSVDETWTIPVGVAKALEHLAGPIAEALGPGFRVTVEAKPDHGVALITAQGQSAMVASTPPSRSKSPPTCAP